MNKTFGFSIHKVNSIRENLYNSSRTNRTTPNGYSVCRADPMKLLANFGSLKIQKGWILRAIQYYQSGNGHARVFALPEGAPFPPTGQTLPDDRLPEEAVSNVMTLILGDHSPWSYLCASLFVREVGEFGAAWHGCSWSTHTLFGADLRVRANHDSVNVAEALPPSDEWVWKRALPRERDPHVVFGTKNVTVHFLTYSGLGRDTLFLHSDRYAQGGYVPRSLERELASGPGGYIF